MKPKLLFLTKLLGFSIGLLALWHPVSQAYVFAVKLVVKQLVPLYELSEEGEGLLQKMSVYLIPFLSLILATPKIPILKKMKITGIGILIFLLTDIIFMLYQFYVEGETTKGLMLSDQVYQNVKLLLPFVLWIIPSYRYFGEISQSQAEANHSAVYSCPICEESLVDVIKHIREVHGERSLKIKKVKNFILENPSVSDDLFSR